MGDASLIPNLILKLSWVLTGGLQQQSPLHWRRLLTPLATLTALCRLKATSKGRDESAKGWAMPNIRTRFAYSDFPIDRRAIGSFADHLADKRGGLKWLADEFDNVLWTAWTITHAEKKMNARVKTGKEGNLWSISPSLREKFQPSSTFTFLHLFKDLHANLNSSLWLHKRLIQRSKVKIDVMKYSCNPGEETAGLGNRKAKRAREENDFY